ITLTAGVLQLSAPLTLTPAVALNGNNTPVAFTGATLSLAGAVLGPNNPLLLATTTTFFNGAVSGNVPLTVSSQPVPTVVATLVNSGILSFQNANSSTSTIVVNGGTFVLGG